MIKSICFTLVFASFATSAIAARVTCSDFSSQQEAQQYMVQHGTRYLDRDKDGEACECLPGGSKHGSSVCRN